MSIDTDIELIDNAESGETVRSAIIRVIQDLNQNGGNAQTLNGHNSDAFTKKSEFDNFVDNEVGQIHQVLDAINKGTTLKVIDLGTHTLETSGGGIDITVPRSISDRSLLSVDDFYADIVSVAGGNGANASWTKSATYDSVQGIYHYTYGALATKITLHFYVKRASAIAVTDYDVHHLANDITSNGEYPAPAGEAWDFVNVNVPGSKTETTLNAVINNHTYEQPQQSTETWNKVIVNVPGPELQTGSVSVTENNYHNTFSPDQGKDGFSSFKVDVNVPFNTQSKSVEIDAIDFSERVVPDSGWAGLSEVRITSALQLEEVTVNQNGDVTPSSDYVGLSAVHVQVPQQSIETGKSVTYSSGGTYTVNPSSGFNAMDSVEVTVQTPRLQPSKSVTLSQSGTITPDSDYDAMEEVVVTVSGGGGCNIMDKATWDAMSFADKKRSGLTVIKNNEYDTTGDWFDYSNISLPFTIRAELYQNTEGNISLPAMDNAIFFTGAWNNTSGNYDNLKLTATSLTYDSKISGSVTPYYYAAPLDKMVTILKNTNPCSLNYRNGYSPNGYYSYGAIISIDDANATLSVLGDFNDDQTHVITTTEVYDAIICMTSKGLQNSSGSNGLIELSGTYDSKYDGDEKLITDLTESCISIYSNVAAGAEITISTPLGRRAGSAVIGVKLNNS